MKTEMSKLEKIRFLVEELGRQAELYELDMLVLVGDREEGTYLPLFHGDSSHLVMNLFHLMEKVGKAAIKRGYFWNVERALREGVDKVITHLKEEETMQ